MKTTVKNIREIRKFNHDLDVWWNRTQELIANAEEVHGIEIGRIIVNVTRDGSMSFEWEDRE
jgi:hypothetical protein